MPSGFQQRWQSKVLAQSLWVGASGITLPTVSGSPTLSPADLATIDGVATVQALTTASTTTTANGPGGVTSIVSSSALTIWNLSAPSAGVAKTLVLAVSSGVFVKAFAGASFDGSTNTVFKSTVNSQVELIGLSSVAYRILGTYPGSTLAASILTLSTTT